MTKEHNKASQEDEDYVDDSTKYGFIVNHGGPGLKQLGNKILAQLSVKSNTNISNDLKQQEQKNLDHQNRID